MNALDLRQKALVAVLAVVGLYGFAVVLWFVMFESSWRSARSGYERAKETYLKQERMIAQRKQWNDDYETEKKAMRTFSAEQATDTTWLKIVGDCAQTNHIWISQLDNGREVRAGDVYELEVVGHGWDGAFESLVRFLYELENTDRGMFDVKAITIKPNGSKKGYLKGSFTVSCAYMREN